tara:strand:+ start:4512 stop:5261 length:750 start_codon:yes stop_codon:yes gene_type:complete
MEKSRRRGRTAGVVLLCGAITVGLTSGAIEVIEPAASAVGGTNSLAGAAGLHGADRSGATITASSAGTYDPEEMRPRLDDLFRSANEPIKYLWRQMNQAGLDPFEQRSFLIEAGDETIPAGTQISITSTPGLLDLSRLSVSDADFWLLGISITEPGAATLVVREPLEAGTSTQIVFSKEVVDLEKSGMATLTMNIGEDDYVEATFTCNSERTTLGELIDLTVFPFGEYYVPNISRIPTHVQSCAEKRDS